MVMLRTDNFGPSSQHRDEMEVYLPLNSFDSIPLSEFPQPEVNHHQSAIYPSFSEQQEIHFPLIPEINHQITHEPQEPPNYECQFPTYPFGTIRESIQQEPPLRTSANFDVFPESYHQFEQFNIDNQASNLIQKYPYMDSTMWNISIPEHLLAPNNNARIFGGNFPIELDATEETTSFASSLAQEMFSLQLPVQTLEESPSLEANFSNKSMPQKSFFVQPEVASIDTEPFYRNWGSDQTRQPQLFNLPFEHPSWRSNITPEIWPAEFRLRNSSDSTMDAQERFIVNPTAESLSSTNAFRSTHRSSTSRFIPIHFQTEIEEHGKSPKEEIMITVDAA